MELPLGLVGGDCRLFFEGRRGLLKPSAKDSNDIEVSLNDDLGVPRRSPARRGFTCEDGPINVVYVIFIICAHCGLFCSLI